MYKSGKRRKKMIELLDGNQTAAYAARLARVQSVPCFPITPQTEVIETIAKWKADGEFNGEFKQVESEHSVLSAAVGSEMTGARTFTATSSQGLMYMAEIAYIASGTRMPLVLVNVSRTLSAPIGLWCDHNDILAMRDAGWLMFISETNQEIMDFVIIAYKVGEDVKLPSYVNMDGFIHSFTREQVDVPEQKKVDRFLPALKLETKLDVNKPMTLGIPVLYGYPRFKSQMHKAQLDAKKKLKTAFREWYKLTGRKYNLVEEYKLKDAEAAVVMIGASTTIAKAAVDELRKKGKRVGLLKISVMRPFPEEEIKKKLRKIKKIGVLDQNIAPGSSGILYPEIKAALFGEKKIISNYVFGLGGEPVPQKWFENMIMDVKKSKKEVRKWLM